MASALLDKGDVAGAAALVTLVSAIDTRRPDVLWLRARIAAAQDDLVGARDTLMALLATPTLTDEQRAEALLSLGLALGDLGHAAEAFAAATQGKRIQRRLFAAQASISEPEVAKIRRLAAWIGTEPTLSIPLPLEQTDGAAASHVFLLGFPRSGTTLLEAVLGAHPDVVTLEEAPTLATLYQAFLSNRDACARMVRLQADEATAWVEHYWKGVREHGVAAAGRTFIDKQPAGTVNLAVIARLFPNARILFALRDPRDVVLSCFRQAFQINAMTYAFTDLAETAACYDACLTLAGRARQHLGLAWSDVRHEALVERFDLELARILDFLGLTPDPAMQNFAARARMATIRTPSATQVRAGLNRRGMGRWQQFRDELAPVLPALAPWVARLGYAP